MKRRRNKVETPCEAGIGVFAAGGKWQLINSFTFCRQVAKQMGEDQGNNHPQSPQKHRLKEFEELEAENERLKAIFDLHSISFNEHSSSKSRRSSEPEPGGRNCVTGALPGEQSSQQTKRCSMSSEGSGSTKYEDVRVKVSPHIKKLKI